MSDTCTWHRARDHPRAHKGRRSPSTSPARPLTPDLLDLDLDLDLHEEPTLSNQLLASLEEKLRPLDPDHQSSLPCPLLKTPVKGGAASYEAAASIAFPECVFLASSLKTWINAYMVPSKLTDLAKSLITYRNSLSTPNLISSRVARHQVRFAVEALLELAVGISQTGLETNEIIAACLEEDEEVDKAGKQEHDATPPAPSRLSTSLSTHTADSASTIDRVAVLERSTASSHEALFGRLTKVGSAEGATRKWRRG
jgi:hypothetical protein